MNGVIALVYGIIGMWEEMEEMKSNVVAFLVGSLSSCTIMT